MRGLQPRDSSHETWPVIISTFVVVLLSGVMSTILVTLAAMVIGWRRGVDLSDGATLELMAKELMDGTAMGVGLGITSTAFTLAIAAVWLCRDVEWLRVLGRLRLGPTPAIDVTLAVFGMLALTTVLSQAILLLGVGQGGSIEKLRELFEAMTLTERAMMLPITAIAAGAAEELFFRGYCLTQLELSSGPVGAVVTSALLFGFIHFDPVHSAAAAAMGLFLGWCVLHSGSLWTSIAAHVVNNAAATLIPDLGPEDPTGQWALLGGATVVFIVVIFMMIRRPRGDVVEW